MSHESTERLAVYEIDRFDQIVHISESWNKFAEENGGAHLTGRVLGETLWDLISDPGIRLLYAALLEEIRSGNEKKLSFPFRCDSPDLVRQCRMVVEKVDPDRVRFIGILEDSTSAAGYRRGGNASSNRACRICPSCSKIETDHGWLGLKDALCGVEILKDLNQFEFKLSECGCRS